MRKQSDSAGGTVMDRSDIEKFEQEFPIALHREEHVILLTDNSATSILLYVYCVRHRIPVLLVDSKTSPEQTGEYIEAFQPYWIFGPLARGITEAYEERREWRGYALCRRGGDKDYSKLFWREDLAVLLPTSGSTGSRKFVMLSYLNLYSNARSIIASLQIRRGDRAAVLLPISYSYGLSVINSYLLAEGVLLVPESKSFEKACWDFLEREQVNAICGVPYSYEMYRKLHLFRRKLSDLKLMTQAGGALGEDTKRFLLREAEERGIDFAVMYGQTEATARISSFFLNRHPEKWESAGQVIPNGALSVWKPDENGCGEIVYEGDNVFLGYAENMEDMLRRSTAGGSKRLMTGDIGYLDREGYLYLTGRKKRFVKLYGNRVSLDDLQKKLSLRAGCRVVCVGDHCREEEMVWIIEEGEDCNPERMRRLLREFPVLRDRWKWISFKTLPRNGNGKTDYPTLLEWCRERGNHGIRK